MVYWRGTWEMATRGFPDGDQWRSCGGLSVFQVWSAPAFPSFFCSFDKESHEDGMTCASVHALPLMTGGRRVPDSGIPRDQKWQRGFWWPGNFDLMGKHGVRIWLLIKVALQQRGLCLSWDMDIIKCNVEKPVPVSS